MDVIDKLNMKISAFVTSKNSCLFCYCHDHIYENKPSYTVICVQIIGLGLSEEPEMLY